MAQWQPKAAPGLPDGLIVFDGVCNLCTRWVRFIIRRDPSARFSFISIQSEAGAAIARTFGVDPQDPQTNIVILDGMALFKLDTVIAVGSNLRGFGWLKLLRIVPRPVRNFVYDPIARSRYRLFGRKDSCMVPTPEIAARFPGPDELTPR